MAPYLGFNRYKRSQDYIVGECKLYDVVEADFEKIEPYHLGEGVFFRGGISTISYLMYHDFKSDWGVYSLNEFFFYIMAVSMEDHTSCRTEGEKMIIGLFTPEKIARIIDIIVNEFDTLRQPHTDQSEYSQLLELKSLLKLAIENNDLILVMWN